MEPKIQRIIYQATSFQISYVFFLQTSIRATFQVEAFQALEATREVVRKGDLAYARAEVSETARREAEETVKRQENEVSCPTSSSASEEYLFTFVGC